MAAAADAQRFLGLSGQKNKNGMILEDFTPPQRHNASATK